MSKKQRQLRRQQKLDALRKENLSTETKKMSKFKPVSHEEMLEVPWKWELETINPLTGKREKTKKDPTKLGEDKDKEPLSLYAQGGEIFLCKSGSTQKLTAMHSIEIEEPHGKVIKTVPYQLAEWTVEVTEREQKSQARG